MGKPVMTKLYRVLYCSRNRIAGDADTVTAQITSILEGPQEVVEAAFERIQCDDRHNDVILLEAGPINERAFPDWSMAFTGGDAGASPLAGGALADAFSGQPGVGSRVLDVLKAVVVRETRWLAAYPEQMAQ